MRPVAMTTCGSHGRPRAQRRRRGGQVLVVMLLGIAALAGLAFYVYNAGQQINRRAETQNTADAVAASGATWMARSLNSVAMNNLSEARALALVPVLDAIPLATEMSFNELEDWIGDNAYGGTDKPIRGLTALLNGLRAGAALDPEARDKIVRGVEAILGRLKAQREILAPLRDLAGPIENATFWSIRGVGGAPPHGQLWRAAKAMDEYSRSIVDSAGLLAQADAVRFGQVNGADAAFVVPVAPQLPAERGSLSDFDFVLRKRLRVNLETAEAAVVESPNMGGAILDASWPQRLGPWSRFLDRPTWYPYMGFNSGLIGWRVEWGTQVWVAGPPRTHTVPPSDGWRIVGPSAGGGVAGRGAGRGRDPRVGGTFTVSGHHVLDPKGYMTFGPYFWARQHVTDFAQRAPRSGQSANLGDTRFAQYHTKAADAKLRYMFAVSPTLEKIHEPQWWTDLKEARAIGEDPAKSVTCTRYYYLEVIYKHRAGSRTIVSDNLSNPVTKEFPGWMPPERLHQVVFGGNPEVTGPEQMGELPMWKFTAWGKEFLYAPDGTVTDEWPVEMVWYFIFTGIDAGGERIIRNPCNWDANDVLPAPWDLTEPARLAYTPDPDFSDEARSQLGPRRQDFAFLGVARRSVSAPFWPQKFASGNPLESVVAVAQAKVMNNKSWDLWTQDWQAQLTSIRGWDDWVQRMDEGVGDAPQTGGKVSAEEVQRLHEYLSRLGSVAEGFLTH